MKRVTDKWHNRYQFSTYSNTQSLHRNNCKGGQQGGDDSNNERRWDHSKAHSFQEVMTEGSTLWKKNENAIIWRDFMIMHGDVCSKFECWGCCSLVHYSNNYFTSIYFIIHSCCIIAKYNGDCELQAERNNSLAVHEQNLIKIWSINMLWLILSEPVPFKLYEIVKLLRKTFHALCLRGTCGTENSDSCKEKIYSAHQLAQSLD